MLFWLHLKCSRIPHISINDGMLISPSIFIWVLALFWTSSSVNGHRHVEQLNIEDTALKFTDSKYRIGFYFNKK